MKEAGATVLCHGTDFRRGHRQRPQRRGRRSNLAVPRQQATVHGFIDSLPEEFRVPLILSAFEELNSREIGRILGIPEGTVRTRLQRARQILRQKLTSAKETHYA